MTLMQPPSPAPSAPASAEGNQWIIEPIRAWPRLELGNVWRHRELVWILIVRDLKVRFRQSIVGFGWIVLQPLLSMGVYTLLFGRMMKVDSDGLPYPVFALCGLVAWTYFVHALTKGTTSLSMNISLLTKVWFPRLALPLAAVLAGLADLLVGLALLAVMLPFYGIIPPLEILCLPLFILLAQGTALGFGLWLSAVNVRYRDVVNALPFLTQILFFLTPIAYSSDLIPARWQLLYHLNPMVTVVRGFRWTLLGGSPPEALPALGSLTLCLVILFFGLRFFRRQEEVFADVV